ncbi:MAG: DUF86 domain-containing protein [Wenzhouxiangella sp.]
MSEREWRFYIDDMIRFAGNVLLYTKGMNQDAFVSTPLNYDATLRNLELIGEAAMHVPDDVRAKNPDIPWRMIIATRNRLTDTGSGVDNDTLWSIIRDDVPVLVPALKRLRKKKN